MPKRTEGTAYDTLLHEDVRQLVPVVAEQEDVLVAEVGRDLELEDVLLGFGDDITQQYNGIMDC